VISATNFPDEVAIKRAKESRFTLSASLLAKEKINVEVISDAGQNPAQFNIRSRQLVLNEATPSVSDNVEALIYDRAKLYHELGHAKFTKGNARGAFASRAKNRQLFLDLSNILEDGRIERLLGKCWPGSRDYLDAILARLMPELSSAPIASDYLRPNCKVEKRRETKY
jgi:hypothetical protein